MAQHKLVIAEKPSVAQSLAAVIGATVRKDGYLEGNGWRVSWCVGHLAGLADADSYDPKYAKWRYDDLPILPEHWQMVVGKDKKKQFDILKKLMNAPDVTEVVNACDAGREGEMIFRSVYELADCQKPMKRLWISSMEDSAIREGFANLRPGADYDGLRDAALCRAKADWLVGINATRLFSVLYHRTLNIGRVMSPTLALIVQREAEIDTFKPVPFYTVALELPGLTVSGERMADKAAAEQLKEACQGVNVTIKKVECKEKSEKPPALYDLTTLQRDANRLLGFTAQQTLDYLQSLYEKKLCTYPRTDSRYLTGDMADSLPVLVNLVANAIADRIVLMEHGKLKQSWAASDFALLSTEQVKALGLRSYTPTRLELPETTPSRNDTPAVEVRDLAIGYEKGEPVAQNLNFCVYPGEIVGVIGKNGCGKSTLARTLCGLQKELHGEVLYKNRTVPSKRRIRKAYLVMQDPDYQLFTDSVYQELLLALSDQKDKDEKRIDDILDELNLTIYKERHPMSLSGGQKQRTAIGVAALRDAEVLIFDEPTSGLDYKNMESVAGILSALSKRGKAILVISHDNELLMKICSRVIRMDEKTSS